MCILSKSKQLEVLTEDTWRGAHSLDMRPCQSRRTMDLVAHIHRPAVPRRAWRTEAPAPATAEQAEGVSEPW